MTIDSWSTIDRLARALRAGETTALALAERAFERVETLDPQLSAFVSLTRDRAVAEARAADERLARDPDAPLLCGIPYAVKDIFDVAGEVTGAGCPVLSDNRASQDSNAVSRLSDAGMVLVGKTRTSPLACEITGLNHSERSPRNPWKSEPHIPGGSSSGSGVAVSAGMVPIALGSDTGGSVRVPAALCGITGHKATQGAIGRGGVLPLAESLDSIGTLARSARDAALVFAALRGTDPRDPATRTGPAPEEAPKGLADCHIVVAEGGLFEGTDSDIAAGVHELAQLLTDLGAKVERREVPIFSQVLGSSEHDDLVTVEAWRNNRAILDAWGEDRDWIANWMMRGRLMDDARLSECRAVQARMQAAFVDWSRGIDAVVAPTVRATTRPIEAVDKDFRAHVGNYVRNTSVGNFLNLCGLSVPVGLDRQGRPIGAMILGRPFSDEQVLGICEALQASGALPDLVPDLSFCGG